MPRPRPPLLLTHPDQRLTLHAGSQLSLSFVSGAGLLATPAADEAVLLAQFRVIFRRGFYLCPPFAAVATLANLGNALIGWRVNGCRLTRKALRSLLAGLCTASLIPFTLMFIVRTEGALLEKATRKAGNGDEGASSSIDRTRELIKRWAKLNYLRSLIPLMGALLSYSAL